MEKSTNLKIEKINSAMDMLQSLKNDVMNEKTEVIKNPEFEDDRLTKPMTAKLAGISIPTLDKLIKAGRFKQYNVGRRKYFLKSEIVTALKTQKS